MRPFKASDMYAPMGDQPRAIGEIAESIAAGNRFQTLKGLSHERRARLTILVPAR